MVSNRYIVNKPLEISFDRALSEKEQILASLLRNTVWESIKTLLEPIWCKKSIIVCLKGNLVLRLIQIFEFDGDVHFFVLDP